MTKAEGSPVEVDSPAGKVETAGTTSVEAPVAKDQQVLRKPRAGDWVISAILLAVFVASFVIAQTWPFRAALFPMIVSVVGALLVILKLVGLALVSVRSRRLPSGVAVVPSARAADLPAQPVNSSPEAVNVRTAAVAGRQARADGDADEASTPADIQIVDEDQEEDESIEYVFATAGKRAWMAGLAWITAFFTLFFVLGAYITVPLFALVYLRVAGRASWWAAALYAVVTGTLIYLVFQRLVFIPLPTGYIPFLQF